jgi:hypothetical protein
MALERAFSGGRLGPAVAVFGILALGGMDGAGLRSAAQFTFWMASADPRGQAADHLGPFWRRGPGGRVGLVSDPWFYTPPLFPDSGLPRPTFSGKIGEVLDQARLHGVVWYVPKDPGARFAWDVRLIDELDPQFVVFSSFEAGDLERLRDRAVLPPDVSLQVERFKAFLAKLESRYQLVRVFGGGAPPVHDLEYVRPTLWLWERRAAVDGHANARQGD